MMQNSINPFYQIQNLLMKISEHVYQINEIIKQMNNLMNQINIPNQMNNLMNQMNNIMSIQNNFNFNNNIGFSLDNQNIPKPKKFEIFNIPFKNETGQKNIVQIQKNKTIGELINSYFQHINLIEFINNYDMSFSFWYNGENLVNLKEKKVEEKMKDGCCPIEVYKIN